MIELFSILGAGIIATLYGYEIIKIPVVATPNSLDQKFHNEVLKFSKFMGPVFLTVYTVGTCGFPI